eukprot:SAG31_NODE_6908_length_1861_cov_1.675399_1_plen_217_part_00
MLLRSHESAIISLTKPWASIPKTNGTFITARPKRLASAPALHSSCCRSHAKPLSYPLPAEYHNVPPLASRVDGSRRALARKREGGGILFSCVQRCTQENNIIGPALDAGKQYNGAGRWTQGNNIMGQGADERLFAGKCRLETPPLQIDEEYNLFEGVDRVVDLCAAPGSWSQVVSRRLFDGQSASSQTRRKAIAVDLQEMAPIDNITCLKVSVSTN